jgi:hypothetical protein
MVEAVAAGSKLRAVGARARPIGTAWRLYALLSLGPLLFLVNTLIGPGVQRPFAPLMAVDFGAFYSGGMLVNEGHARDLGEMDAQRDAQRRLQEDEATDWRWYNALPHPPVTSLFVAPLALLPLRIAFWFWAAAGLLAALLAAWVLARALAPTAAFGATLVLFSFEPIWDVAWWGQLDTLLLLPVAAGSVLLLREPDRQRELAAGALLGALALKPIFVPVVLLTLLWGRPRAALGMTATGAALALISLSMVGIEGVKDYVDLARYYQQFSGSPAIVEWRMYNLRGLAIRLGFATDEGLLFAVTLGLSLLLAALTIAVAGEALRRRHAPDLALGLMLLGTVLTAYHVHVQSLVFLTIPLAAWLGRSLAASSRRAALLWALPVVAIHGGAFLLKPEQPSPAPSEAKLETMLTVACLAALVGLVVVLLARISAGVRDPESSNADQPTRRTARPSAVAT